MKQSKIDAIEEGLACIKVNLLSAKTTHQPMFIEIAIMQVKALLELFDMAQEEE